LISISSNKDENSLATNEEDGEINENSDDQMASSNISTKNRIIKLSSSNLSKSSNKNEEDGELNDEDTDDDLEEGELKDDDDPLNQSLDTIINKQSNNDQLKKVPCKFYLNGNCSWGDQCRFSHSTLSSSSNNYKSSSNNQPYSRPTQQTRNYSSKPNQYNNKQYDNNRYNNDDEPDPPPRYRLDETNYANYDNRYTSSSNYERKRRLALESAPWNNEDYGSNNEQRSRTESYRNRYDDNYPINKHSNSSSFSDFSSSSEKSFKQRQRTPTEPISRKRKYSNTSSPNLNKNYQHSKRGRDFNNVDNDSSPSSSFFSDSADEAAARATPPPIRRHSSRERVRHSRERGHELDSRVRSKQSSSGYHHRTAEREEKKPIKMTFMRKQSALSSKGVKIQDEFDSDEQDDSFDNAVYAGKEEISSSTKSSRSPKVDKSTSKSSGASREELLKRLKEIDQAISKKRSIAQKQS